jgi:SAM-dependent methyltransferase
MSGDYDALARDYHWLVPDELLADDYFVTQHRALLTTIPPGSSVLDCACGIGRDAMALARAGYQVCASDASPVLVAEAQRRAQHARLAIAFATCQWEDLPQRFAKRFALVLCTGNSISHCRDRAAMVRALRAMRAVLVPEGTLILDTRNWEKLRREQPRLSLSERVVQRGNRRCIPLYLWHFPPAWDERHTVELVLLFDEEGRLSHRRYVLEYRPFPLRELQMCLAEAGFDEVQTDYREEADRYTVQARRVEGRHS